MTTGKEPAEVTRVKSSLRRLGGPDNRTVIERAVSATDELRTAARFVENVGLPALEAAIERIDDPELQSQGQTALESFRRFQRAAAGDSVDHFHRGHGTDLRPDAEASTQ